MPLTSGRQRSAADESILISFMIIKEMTMSAPVVLITGGLTGIGRAAAFAFAKAGNRVVVSGRRPDAGEAVASELRALGAEAEFI
jgi:NADP-dependent 3-hydroxy acid dehydrogenase YdfG